ncbi:MAG: phenylacetate--CoA ligase family protein, partial [Thermoplasmatales archaeon]
MNPFLNPWFLFQILKSYLLDTNRLYRMSSRNLKKFQDKAIKKMVQYAYDVPIYKNKYKECGVHPDDINGIDDIQKLPFITKDDIRKNLPDGIVSPTFNKGKAITGSTSGTTGPPSPIYGNMYAAAKWLCGEVRIMKEHNINWRKTRITVITDLSENSIERKYIIDGIISNLKPFFSLNNMQILHSFDDPKKTIEKINSFQPEFISGNPGMFKKLAQLKRMGYGKDIRPRCMTTVGAVLDNFLKKIIEETFETQLFDGYGATEVGPIAFQCKKGKYHINSDLVYLEAIDDNGEWVSPGELGHVVATRLFGEGTPIIRYTGIDDLITITDGICNCGLAGKLIKEIHGRETQSIVLQDG